jgi:hypothetical protein
MEGYCLKCKNLDVWKKSTSLSSEVYLELAHLKDFGFKDQLTRSGLSIPNIGNIWIEELEEIGKMLTGLIKSMNKRESQDGN